MFERVDGKRSIAEKEAARTVIQNKLRDLVAGKQGVDALVQKLGELNEMKFEDDYQEQEQKKVNEIREELFLIFRAANKKGLKKAELDQLYGIMLTLTDYWPANQFIDGQYVDLEGVAFGDRPKVIFSGRVLTLKELAVENDDKKFEQEREYVDAIVTKAETRVHDFPADPEPPQRQRFVRAGANERRNFMGYRIESLPFAFAGFTLIGSAFLFLLGLCVAALGGIASIGLPAGFWLMSVSWAHVGAFIAMVGMAGSGLAMVGIATLVLGVIGVVIGAPLATFLGYIVDKFSECERVLTDGHNRNSYKWGAGIGVILGIAAASTIAVFLFPFAVTMTTAAGSVIASSAFMSSVGAGALISGFLATAAHYILLTIGAVASTALVTGLVALTTLISTGMGLLVGVKVDEWALNRPMMQQYRDQVAQNRANIAPPEPDNVNQAVSPGQQAYNDISNEIVLEMARAQRVNSGVADPLRQMRRQSQSSQPLEDPPNYADATRGRTSSGAAYFDQPGPPGGPRVTPDGPQTQGDKKPSSGAKRK